MPLGCTGSGSPRDSHTRPDPNQYWCTMERVEAHKLGLKRYFTGRACVQGHVAERITSSFCCMDCKRKLRRPPKEKMSNIERKRERLGIPSYKDSPLPPEDKSCQCCGKSKKNNLHLDHDHLTGEFRGWICYSCNIGIGLLGDQLPDVEAAHAYLERVFVRSLGVPAGGVVW